MNRDEANLTRKTTIVDRAIRYPPTRYSSTPYIYIYITRLIKWLGPWCIYLSHLNRSVFSEHLVLLLCNIVFLSSACLFLSHGTVRDCMGVFSFFFLFLSRLLFSLIPPITAWLQSPGREFQDLDHDDNHLAVLRLAFYDHHSIRKTCPVSYNSISTILQHCSLVINTCLCHTVRTIFVYRVTTTGRSRIYEKIKKGESKMKSQ